MNLNRKTLLMLILMLIGFAFAYMGLNLSPLGFLITLGAWILVIAPAYNHYRTQKRYEEKYSRSQAPSCADFLRVPPSRPLFYGLHEMLRAKEVDRGRSDGTRSMKGYRKIA